MAEGLGHFELNTGARIPSVGLGSYGLTEEDIIAAVKIGYRHIDCAALYGNEKEVGCALKRLFGEGVVKREDLFITSKLWGSDHLPEDVPVSLEITLNDLQLDYVDLYLIHWPVSFKKGTKSDAYCPDNLTIPDIPSTWREMEALYESRKARAIGVSNFSTKKLSDLLAITRVPPAVNQVELHPAWQQPKLHQFCQSHGVHLTGYSPLGSPFWGPEERNVLDRPVVKTTAERLGKTPAQVVLRWGLQAGHSVIPKSKTESRLKENLDLFHWSIPQDKFLQFSEIKQERFATGAFYVHEAYGTYRSLDDLWDGEI